MSERKFARGLGKPGTAAQLRETVSQVVRESTVQNKPRLVEPLDFEKFVIKNKTVLQNDPQRELLLYPTDDISRFGSERSFVNIGSKSFKRRYCYLRQEVDGTYILELYKDEKKGEAKVTIVMDFCTDVVKNLKRGRFCFELRMTAGHKSYLLAAENESDLKEWLSKLSSVLQQNKIQEEKRAASLERERCTPPPSPQIQPFGTLKGLEQSMNPQLMKYARETDVSIAASRKDNRSKVFELYPNLAMNLKSQNSSQDQIEPYREIFGHRVFLRCESIRLKLQAVDEKENLCQVEPYHTTLCLYDAKNGRKLTENFHFDVNSNSIRNTFNNGICTDSRSNYCKLELPQNLSSEWLLYPRQALFSIANPHPDIFLVIRIEKVLQGGICQSSEPYVKAHRDPKISMKVYKNIAICCQRLGKYRMPFAWAARPLFRLYSKELDTTSDFHALYRQEPNKITDEELLKLLSDYRKPDKFNKFTVIPGSVEIKVSALNDLPANCLSTSLAPLKPFPLPPTSEPTVEITEFEGLSEKDVNPYTTFINHLYVYPLNLSFDTQKTFTRARNIACVIEVRDSDNEEAKGLQCIYGRPGQAPLVSQVSCAVLHHNTIPTWYEEVKIRLPTNILYSHHLLFTFYHISCDITKKRENGIENCVGYAWLPLLQKGKLNVETQVIPVASHLPPGYLSIHPFGLGKGNAGPEINWVDGQKPIFSIAFNLVSTINTKDQHLFNLFMHAERLLDPKPSAVPSEGETCKILKALHAIHLTTLITFLPTLFNQLFTLLVVTASEEIGLNIIRVLINLVNMIYDANRKEILQAYVKYVFISPEGKKNTTMHEEMCKHLPKSLSLVDRGFVFKLINNYMDKFNPGDSRLLQEYKFSFLEIICSHEHYVSFNLPIQHTKLSPRNRSPDNFQEFTLSEEFCKHHFIVGLLLQEIKTSLNEVTHIRKIALNTLKSLVAKHELDDRYQSKGQMHRISLIYLPWLSIVLENLTRLDVKGGNDEECNDSIINRISSSSSYLFGKSSTASECTPRSHRFTLHIDKDSPMHIRNSAFFEAIAGQYYRTLCIFAIAALVNGNSLSIDSDISAMSGDAQSIASQDTTIIRDDSLRNGEQKSHTRSTSHVQRYDKLQPQEIKDVLLIFLFVVKYLNEEQLITWWQNYSEADVVNFFAVLEMCLHCFKYVGKRNVSVVKSIEGDNLKAKSKKAHTLPARINPQEINHENTSTLVIHTNRENLISSGNAVLCGRLCYELLKCCNSRLASIRQESCAILYLLMRSNFEFTSRKGLTRVHLQVIISVSQMLGNIVGLNNARFQESLSLINSYASSDKAMKGTGFPVEVKDLTKRVRTVLMATIQMREHHHDPEMLVDLQHSLANSYASTPELRHTWLETMTRNHVRDGNYSEAACCQLHIAALMAEYLKLKNIQNWGAESFKKISSNISKDEKGLKLDAGVQDIQYTEFILLEQLETCADFIDKAERYEIMGELYKLIIPMHEKKRNYELLRKSYHNLAQNYEKIVEINKSCKRLLGRYYRVGFYGQAYFEEENGVEYVYKEPKVTSLSEISERLYKQYCDKFGQDVVKMIQDSTPVSKLLPQTGIHPSHSRNTILQKSDLEERQTEFEQNHDINCFMYETPFTKDGKARGNPEEQWKRRTILTTIYSFPYVKKRIVVQSRRITELSPIEVAIDEMQLRLQGSVCVQVNAGPLAYASVFLDPALCNMYPEDKVEELKDIYRVSSSPGPKKTFSSDDSDLFFHIYLVNGASDDYRG
ncbi:hypothetical protein NQ314_009378 [Rhamnusium bicolor]|uniref:Dedicator of cytokinesis protein 9 n=1 Tax=Rhamnusium bicolor TaxID=1586634 RepID=A0AAV8Y1F9_9CUCU|nr:hypothetical protein NQ314_009378 [Rhamnusium bicolor]